MICSPCIHCPRKNQPKEECSKNCKLLQKLQDIQLSAEDRWASSAIDYTAENRYTLSFDLNRKSLAV